MSPEQVLEKREELRKLAEMLRQRPMTAKTIAEATGCCKAIAYRRVRALDALGVAVSVERAPKPAGQSGPRASAFRVTGGIEDVFGPAKKRRRG